MLQNTSTNNCCVQLRAKHHFVQPVFFTGVNNGVKRYDRATETKHAMG